MAARLVVLIVTVQCLLVLYSVPAHAAQGPEWHIYALSASTVSPGDTFRYIIDAKNEGFTPTDGTPIEFRVSLPPGMTVVREQMFIPGTALLPACTAENGDPPDGQSRLVCSNTEVVNPTKSETMLLTVAVDAGASGHLVSSFSVRGGGGGSATTSDSTIVGGLPEFGIDAFDGIVTGDSAGDAFTQAGGHPYAISTSIDVSAIDDRDPLIDGAYPVEAPKDIFVDLPPGLVGNPTGAAQCTLAELANASGLESRPLCPPASQVGITQVRYVNGTFSRPAGSSAIGPIPVFNIAPPPNVPARFGFNVLGTLIVLDGQVRSGGDYGITVAAKNVPEGIGLDGTTVTFWGDPSDPSHDAQRACPGQVAPGLGGATCTSGAPSSAFLRNPTSCPDPGVGLPTTLRMDSWAHPGIFKEASFISHLAPGYPLLPSDWGAPQGPTGCAKVPFEPVLTGTPAPPARNASPDGFGFDLSLPQDADPGSIGESDLRKAVVTLPAGVRVNPSSAHGLGSCTPAQIGLHDDSQPSCPNNSRVGSVTINTPLLRDPLAGSVYLASPYDNPFDSLLAIYVVAEGPGTVVKLAGHVDPDPITGQLTTTFDDNPQLPFSRLHLEFNSDSSTAPLVTPMDCGRYTTTAELTSWSGKIVDTTDDFFVSHDGAGGACPPPHFSPGFTAGTENPSAGKSSPFHLRITRQDDEQELSGVSVDMPNGLTGKIANVAQCGEADAQAGTCPDASKVGSVTVGAGAGTNPFYITDGKAYLTGPYKGAPFGLAIVVHAAAGPFDLGTVVVRSSIFVDKHTAQLKVASDPLPTILQGIMLQVRDVRVAVDRPDFIVNPTSCATKTIGGTLTSTEGMTANVSSRFQVGDCASLGFKPRMALSVGSVGHTARNATTPFSTTLKMPSGNANLRSVKVSLPTTINARLNVINRACTRAAYEAGHCESARAGTAVAKTPLLKDPLRGNVYFVKNGNPIPDLFIALRGQVSFDLIGKVSIPGGVHLATTFDAIPDVPVKSFTLKLISGAKGSVGAATNLCTKRGRNAKAQIDYIGQNGRVSHVSQKMKVNGCGKAKHKKARATRGTGAKHRRGR